MSIHPILKLIEKARRSEKRLLGAEVERFGEDGNGNILQYTTHVLPLFKELVNKASWKTAAQENGLILALQRDRDVITLEPGAQIEIALAPSENLFNLADREREISEELLATETAENWKWKWIAVNPTMSAEEVELIPSSRYKIMTEYFPHVAKRGVEMMRLTAGSHLNLDFYRENEAIELIQASCFLIPVVGAAFPNSPIYKGSRGKALSERSLIWEETDPSRSGLPELFFSSDLNLKNYVNLVESIPLMYFSDEAGSYTAAQGRALKDLPPLLLEKNALAAMRQLFTDVRIKPCCVEFRALDQQRPEYRSTAFALIVGILYDDENRVWAQNLALETGHEKTRRLQHTAALEGLKNDFLFNLFRTTLKRAEEGLIRRGLGEEKLLGLADNMLQTRKTPAEHELDQVFPEEGQCLGR